MICALPKRVCDAGMCEIDRFLRLTNNVVEVVSFIVPRKTQATHFQADIFPPAPSGQPGLSAAKWLSGASAVLPTISMKPANLPDDAPSPAPSPSLSPTAGSTPVSGSLSPTIAPIPAPFSAPAHAGPMLLEVKGWFYTAYEPKFFSISANQTLYCFANKDSAEALFALPLSGITELKIDPNHGMYQFSTKQTCHLLSDYLASRFVIYNNMLPNSFHMVEAYNQTERDKWMRALVNTKTAAPTPAAAEVTIS